ncbi:probable helicase senataxin isoform X2 [Eurosta solidaginis]|uniref:probable helicase senataxin isoform X2 n=1 Tax=Eurosta solidaginis TaxID=178769 RepID=UPI0035315FD6
MSERDFGDVSPWFLERKLFGDRIRLFIGLTLVGRHAGSTIVIDSTFVSRKHAEIIIDKSDNIVLKDLNSQNGTYVNGTKIKNEKTTLKENDCIGIGVTDDSEPNLKHPIYKLIYSPLPKSTSTAQESVECKKPNKKSLGVRKGIKHETTKDAEVTAKDLGISEEEPCTSNVAIENLKKEAAAISITKPQIISFPEADNDRPIAEETRNAATLASDGTKNKDTSIGASKVSENVVGVETTTTPSTSLKLPILLSGEIIVLSDDDDDDIRPTIKQESKNTAHEKDSNIKEHAKSSKQHIIDKCNNLQTNTITSDKEPNSDQIPQNPANGASVHEPILPDVKREFVRSCTKNVVDIFGGADDLILESVKTLNPLVYTTLNGKRANKPLYNGDKIDLSSDNEDDDRNVDQNEEIFGQLVPVEESRNNNIETKAADENTIMKSVENRGKETSPNLFDYSLNSSTDLAEENNKNEKKAEDSTLNQEKNPMENAAKDAEELAEFVDMDDDMMFSQILINDIKSEMMAGNNEDFTIEDETHSDKEEDDIPQIHIKEEPIDYVCTNPIVIPQKQNHKNYEIENDIWIISDDEFYDEEFEHKVSDWSTKLLSQKMNMSQVFDLPNDRNNDLDKNDEDNEEEDVLGHVGTSDDLDDFFNEALVDDVIATLAQKTGEENPILKSTSEAGLISNDTDTGYDSGTRETLSKHKEDKSELNETSRIAALARKPSSELIDHEKGEKSTISKKISTNHERHTSSDNKESTSNEQESRSKKELIKPVKRLHHPPSVIDAPSLPKHKGKHRGVSAETRIHAATTTDVRKKASAVSAQIKDERYREELKKKWLEKPIDERRRENEKKRKIKESRKERLKELADKQAAESTNNILKRKHTPEREAAEKKKAKVKVTAMNRGALLAEDMESTKKPSSVYRIPKTKRPSTDTTKIQKDIPTNVTASISKTNSKISLDAFAQDLTKVDQVNRRFPSNSNNGKSLSRSSSMDGKTASETRGPNAPARRTNKISFASMQKNFIESRKNQELLENLASNRSCLIDVKHRNADNERQKKKVRFNEIPIVHYIERINGANKRVDCKDILPSPTCSDRAHLVRLTYAMVDKTPEIISQILGWSNEWLVNRNAQVDAASDILLPMPIQFSTFNHYKSIVIPLMKLEFISVLEREKQRIKTKTFNVNADQVTPYMDRFIIMARYGSAKISDTKCELVVLEWGRFTTFAYMSSKRIGISTTTIVYEVLAKDLNLEELRANLCKTITVRPMIDIVRVEFGAFNAIYQLEQSPLTKQIIDPMELFKLKPFPKRSIQYCGFDDLNERQKEVLMNIYRRAIEPTPNIALIQGPPGTGKSCVIANLVHQLLYGNEVRILDQKVLICAQSNAAVDAIAEKLFNMSQKKVPDNMFRLIRFGLLERISPKVQHATLPKIIERNQIRKLKMACSNLQLDNIIDIKEYLRNEIISLEADIEHMNLNSIKGTVQEEQLLEKIRQVQLMRNIVNGTLRPEDERSLYNWHLMHANVVCTTLSSCVKLSQYVNYFDICIIDEATQCTEPWTLMPLKFGINTLVLVGDTQQLPATVISKRRDAPKSMQL